MSVDGICSSVLIYDFLVHNKYPKSKIKVIFHTDKSHGIVKEIYEQIPDNSLVIVPDAHCDDKWGKLLVEEKQCLIIDFNHHEISEQKYSLSINNQHSPLIKNKALSGTGVTFQFIKYYCQKNNDTYYKKLLDMVMWANISDIMSMKCYPYENRLFNEHGIRKICNPFLKYLIQECCDDEWSLNDLVFKVSPLANSLCRSDNQELKAKLFNCFVGNDTDFETCLKELKSNKSKQDYQVKKMFENANIIHNGSVIIAECERGSSTGLAAQKLMSKHNKPVFLGHKSKDRLRGSFRFNLDIKEKLQQSGLFDYLEGHRTVGGFSFQNKKYDDIVDCVENLGLNTEQEYTVCKSYTPQEIPEELFGMSDKYINYWVTDVPSPVFHIRDIVINTKDIQYLNKYKTTIKFRVGDVSFIRSYCSRVWREENGLNEPNTNLHIEVVGELQLDDLGFKTVKIRNIEIEREVEKEENWEDLF